MSGADYKHGEMDISSQKKMWDGFVTATAYGTLLTVLLVGFLTLVFAMGMHWAVSLGLTLIVGAIAGALMNMGLPWFITMGAFAIIVIVTRILMAIFGLLM